SPATKRMRDARMWDISGSFLTMSATMRRQRSVALGLGARRARTRERMDLQSMTCARWLIASECGRSELLGADGARADLGSLHARQARAAARAADREVRSVDRRPDLEARHRV